MYVYIYIHLADELTPEGIDDARDGRCRPLTDKVEVEHPLDGTGLHATGRVRNEPKITIHTTVGLLDKASSLVMKKGTRKRGMRSASRTKASNVVIGRQIAAGIALGGRHYGRAVYRLNIEGVSYYM